MKVGAALKARPHVGARVDSSIAEVQVMSVKDTQNRFKQAKPEECAGKDNNRAERGLTLKHPTTLCLITVLILIGRTDASAQGQDLNAPAPSATRALVKQGLDLVYHDKFDEAVAAFEKQGKFRYRSVGFAAAETIRITEACWTNY